MKKIFINIKELLKAEQVNRSIIRGDEMKKIGRIKKAFLVIEGNKIESFGEMKDVPKYEISDVEVIDLKNKHFIMPTFVDSHTHLVFAGSREKEFVDKINGLSYAEIAKRGGGILNSAALLHETSEEYLLEQATERLKKLMRMGTGAIEVKSGYGLNLEDEMKMLRVVKRLQDLSPIDIVPTFLAAHAVPKEYKQRHSEFVDLVVKEMIPAVAAEKLSDYIDVFCEQGFFTVQDTQRILEAGIKHGMRPKIHANQLGHSGGVQVGVKYNALSVDHLEFCGDDEIQALKGSDTMPTILPGSAFFLGLPFSPVRKMINAGLPVAMASDYNPGSAPSGNMKLVMALACIKYKMLPEEALNSVTSNTAYSIGLQDKVGSITVGKYANFIVTQEMPSFEYFPYSFGENLIKDVFINGEII